MSLTSQHGQGAGSYDAYPRALRSPLSPFTARLRDLLSTIETTAIIGTAEARVRGLGEHLRFACLSLPCSEALVALEIEALGRLTVPVVADQKGFRYTHTSFPPSGTPFAYLLGGGAGYAAELGDSDPMIASLLPLLNAPPKAAVFVPIRLSEVVIGGAALLSHDTLGESALEMAERLAEVLALTVESFRTECIVFELFARALPDLLTEGAHTSLRSALQRHIGMLRVTPEYRLQLQLATVVGRLADQGPAETQLAMDILSRMDAYTQGLRGLPEIENA